MELINLVSLTQQQKNMTYKDTMDPGQSKTCHIMVAAQHNQSNIEINIGLKLGINSHIINI